MAKPPKVQPRKRAADPTIRRLPGAIQPPYYQGEFDGLCGLYAFINAATLVLAPHRPLTHEEATRLFKLGIAHLEGVRRLPAGVRWGMSQPVWRRLCDHLAGEVPRLIGVRLLVMPLFQGSTPPQAADVVTLVEDAIRMGQAVMLLVRGDYSHFTTVSGFSAARLLLHDSYGLKWLDKANAIGPKPRRRIIGETVTIVEFGGPIEASQPAESNGDDHG